MTAFRTRLTFTFETAEANHAFLRAFPGFAKDPESKLLLDKLAEQFFQTLLLCKYDLIETRKRLRIDHLRVGRTSQIKRVVSLGDTQAIRACKHYLGQSQHSKGVPGLLTDFVLSSLNDRPEIAPAPATVEAARPLPTKPDAGQPIEGISAPTHKPAERAKPVESVKPAPTKDPTPAVREEAPEQETLEEPPTDNPLARFVGNLGG